MAKNRIVFALAVAVFFQIFLPPANTYAELPLSKGFINSEGNWVESIEQKARRLEWLKQAKYGMIIHWGLYSVAAGEYKGEVFKQNGEWIQGGFQIPCEEYEQLAKEFNPTKFNAEDWVKLAKESGMKYIIMVAKHYDGFAMFESKVSKYNMVDATSFKRDPIKELAQACKKHNIKFGLLYSVSRDWHEPDAIGNWWDFPEGITNKQAPQSEWGRAEFDHYFQNKAIPQIKELLTNYGKIGLFFCLYSQNLNKDQAYKLINVVHEYQPDCIVNKLFLGQKDKKYGLGDIDDLFERVLRHEIEMPETWAFLQTMNNSWGYAKNDNNWQSIKSLITKMVDAASKNGNFVLNVGPNAEGVIPQQAVESFHQIGQWLKVNGQSIYGTDPSPFGELSWGRCTAKPGKLYMHTLIWPENGKLEITRLENKVDNIYLLANGQQLKFDRRENNILVIDVPQEPIDPYDTVIVLDINSPPKVTPLRRKLVSQDISGHITCLATQATINTINPGGRIARINESDDGYIGYWVTSNCYITWRLAVKSAGDFDIELTYSCRRENNNKCIIEVAGERFFTGTPNTGDWKKYKTINIGQVNIGHAGEYVLMIKYVPAHKIVPVNLKSIRLVPIPKEDGY